MSGVFAISFGVGITLALSGCGGGTKTTTSTIGVPECTKVVSGMDKDKCVGTSATCSEKLSFCASCPAGDDTQNAKIFADASTSAQTAKDGADLTLTNANTAQTKATQQEACYTSKHSTCSTGCVGVLTAPSCAVYVGPLDDEAKCSAADCATFCGSCPTTQEENNKNHFAGKVTEATAKVTEATTKVSEAEGEKTAADKEGSCYGTQHTICACTADEHSVTIFSTV